MASDEEHTIREAMDIVRRFCEERDWDQFHNPKDLTIGMVTESAELLEVFRFKTDDECKEIIDDAVRSQHVMDELADVFYFVLRFAQMNDIDLYDALSQKIERNCENYPVDKSRGSNRKYDEF